MSDYRYILEKSSKKHQCPECLKKTFVRYIDTETKNYLPDDYGRCDREIECAYWLNPYKDGYSKMIFEQEKTGTTNYNYVKPQPRPAQTEKTELPTSYIESELLNKSLGAYEQNNFVTFLHSLFPDEIVKQVTERYLVGTSRHWNGSTVFWQVDTQGKIRSGKIMLYDAITGKRVKKPYNRITWVHSALKRSEYNLRQCLFGEHLLNEDKTKPIAVCESAKSAIIASIYLPKFIWLACDSLSGLTYEKCKVLAGRKVILYPDLSKPDGVKNCFQEWSKRADELKSITTFYVSDLLELNATDEERENAFDLADYFIQFKYENLTKPHICDRDEKLTNANIQDQTLTNLNILDRTDELKSLLKIPPAERWDIEDLENYFKGIDIPVHPIKLNHETRLDNVELFIKLELELIKNNNGKRAFKPAYDRLKLLQTILEKDSCK